jgi:lysophospholipase L1-like esterase
MKILLAGDSTVANCPTYEYPMSGWGAHLGSRVYSWAAVYNYAKGGASTESFREDGLWPALLQEAGQGDLVLIQFGHNDQKHPHLAARTGYAANLRTMLGEVRSLGATPVLCTSVERRHFLRGGGDGGEIATGTGVGNSLELEESLEDYPAVVRELAAELQVPLIELNTWTRALYLELGEEASKALFCHFEPGEHAFWPEGLADNTHFNEDGARLVAGYVAAQLIQAGLGANERGFSEPGSNERTTAGIG